MLVLTRKANEEITIGNDVRVIVLGVQGNRVRLGLIAPGDVKIQRTELMYATDDDSERNQSELDTQLLCHSVR
jgi:carbon storage regulator